MILNNVVLMGRFTHDLELQKTSSGISCVNFTLAVNNLPNKKNKHPESNFIDCVAWRGIAESICKFFTKGSRIIIVGSIRTRKYQDKDGNNRKFCEIVADDFAFVDKKAGIQNSMQPEVEGVSIEENDDELPY